MKKVISICLLVALAVMTAGPAVATAQVVTLSPSATTTLTPQTGGGASDPMAVMAKWEMVGPCLDANNNYVKCVNAPSVPTGEIKEGQDDSTDAGSQFVSPNEWDTNMNYTVCAVVHGPDKNISNIKNVIAEIFYPDAPMHTSVASGSCAASAPGVANVNGAEIDAPQGGCEAKIEQNFLHKLSQADGKALVCNAIQSTNANLITWKNDIENYTALCNDTNGELTKGYAAVYCADKKISHEDPAGAYKVDVFGYDSNNSQTVVFTNYYQYLETTGYEIDFDGVIYGSVQVGNHKKVYGDKCFFETTGVADAETIRNTGNVRLAMSIAQDDMGLGYKTGSLTDWNVGYDARVGDLEADWSAIYRPFAKKGVRNPVVNTSDYTPLVGEILDLSEIEEMDFSIIVEEKFPENQPSYSGAMWLNATKAPFDECAI